MDYGNRMKQLRLSRDLRQIEIAEILGVSPSAVGSYERFERQQTYEMLAKYAKYFSVSINHILCNSDEKIITEEYQHLTTIDLTEAFHKHKITFSGVELSDDDKQRILDIATVLLFERIK